MRLDVYLFENGYVKSRQNAKVLIQGGGVKLDGKIVSKPAFEINDGEHTVEIVNQSRFVSRGGEKLTVALDEFAISVEGLDCIDIGASTGGFTDCLLQRGANLVYAVDSGHSQLDSKLVDDEKVVSIEKFNARYMSSDDFPILFDIAVMDVSFISQTFIHKPVYQILKDGGYFVSLIKPQFECGKNALNSHGIVKKSAYHLQAINRVIDSGTICGFSCIDIIRSPIEGGSGNVEFLILMQKNESPINLIPDNKILRIIKS